MSGTEKTPGHAAYVAYSESFTNIDNPGWNYLDDAERDRWEAAATAGAAPAHERAAELLGELNAVRGERDAFKDGCDYERKRVIDLTAIVAEILGKFGPSGSGHAARVGQVQIAKWYARAGIPLYGADEDPCERAAPAMTGAGAEHVAAQLLDPGNPGAWQRVADMPAEG